MSFVFSSDEFINKLRWLTNDVKNVYASGKGIWCTYYNNRWRMDCVCSIKGILWGFDANIKKKHGGAIYKSNGVADFTCNGALKYCSSVSKDFSNLVPGEYLCMKDTEYNHSGIYLGNGKVFECTTGWGVNRCIISDISNKGIRSYNGKKLLKWTYHGKLNYINYSSNKSYYELACEVIQGKYGNGDTRKKKLGSNYRKVQDIVNDIVRYKGNSIVDILNKIDIDSSYSNRQRIAKLNGINNYSGTANQNLKMLSLLKSGLLKI